MNTNPNEYPTNFAASQEEETMFIRKRFVGINTPEPPEMNIDADPIIEICLSSDSGLSIDTWWDDCGNKVTLVGDEDPPQLPNISELIILLIEVKEYARRTYPEQYRKHINQIF